MKDPTLIQNYPLYIYGGRDNNICVKENIETIIEEEYTKERYKVGNIGFNKAMKVVFKNV